MNDTNTGTVTTAARAAAEWWAQQIADPTFRNTTAEEDRASSANELLGAVYARGLAGMLSDRHPVTAEQLATFTNALETIIIRDTREDGWHYGLHVDYHPDSSLTEAAQAAGVDESRFPWKTHLWLRMDGTVIARLGYGAPERLVWAPDGWQRPACGDLRHEPKPGGGLYDVTYHPELCGRPKYHEALCGDWMPDTAACDECGKSQADHWNGSYDDFGHLFRTADDAR